MRPGSGYVLRFRGAVISVALERKSDPGRADRVIGAGGKDQFVGDAFLGSHIDQDLGIERIVRIRCNIDDRKRLIGHFVFVSRNGTWKTGDDSIACIEGQKGGLRKEDHDPGNGR